MSLFAEKTITSMPEMIAAMRDVVPRNSVRWFRGQSQSRWALEPGLVRSGGLEREIPLIKRFRQNAIPHADPRPAGEWHWLFLMQHHGLPTRLLDWSENPLVALFFAVERDDDVDGTLWVLDPAALNQAAKFTFTPPDFPAFEDDDELDRYLPSNLKTDKIAYGPVAAIARRYFPRLVVQAGVFTITHKEHHRLDEYDDGKYVGKIIVPAKFKKQVRDELKLLGITHLFLFPELDRVAAHAKEVIG